MTKKLTPEQLKGRHTQKLTPEELRERQARRDRNKRVRADGVAGLTNEELMAKYGMTGKQVYRALNPDSREMRARSQDTETIITVGNDLLLKRLRKVHGAPRF